MTNVMTTKLSSKGQVVLPEALRNMFGWGAGTSFTVLAYKGAVIMQPIKAPTEEDLAREFDEAFALGHERCDYCLRLGRQGKDYLQR